MSSDLILTINPGSTSTKFTLFNGDEAVVSNNVDHSVEDLSPFEKMVDQFEYRYKVIISELKQSNVDMASINAVVGRGGLLKPMQGGTYEICEQMLNDLKEAKRGEHASNLGGLIAKAIADEVGCPSFIVDPVVVDEMDDIARLSGNPLLPRTSIFHALNQKRTARIVAEQIGKSYEESNIIVAHLGGGISVGIHSNGRVVDVNNALDGDGTFTPERSGSVPVGQMVSLCFGGKYSEAEIKKMIKGEGGMTAYLGTNDLREVEKRIASGDDEAKAVRDAMVYQIAKDIGQMATVVSGKVDAIGITGGMAHSEQFISMIENRVSFISKVVIIPGENEMEALRDGAARVIRGEEKAMSY